MKDYAPESLEVHVRIPYRKGHLPVEQEGKLVRFEAWQAIKSDLQRIYGPASTIHGCNIAITYSGQSATDDNGRREIIVSVPRRTIDYPAVREMLDGVILNIYNVVTSKGIDPKVIEVSILAQPKTDNLEDIVKTKSRATDQESYQQQ